MYLTKREIGALKALVDEQIRQQQEAIKRMRGTNQEDYHRKEQQRWMKLHKKLSN